MKLSLRRSFIASSLMLAALVSLFFLSRVEEVPPIKPLATFPRQIGNWKGIESRFDQKVYDVLGVDDSFLCDYLDPHNRHVQLYIGFYRSQREGELIHSPKHCMPGGGWNITLTQLEEITVPGKNSGKEKVIKLLLQKGKDRQVVLYWFQARGRYVSSEYMQKIYLVWDSIFKNRTDESFIRLISRVADTESQALEVMKGFTEELIPLLKEYLPGA
jgi:EpsI family protein